MTDDMRAIDKWRYAKLVELHESGDDDDGKLMKLQELYADFEYPQDMSSCSIYSQSSESPLAAMKKLVSSLSRGLSKENYVGPREM